MSNWTENRVVDWARDHFSATPISGVWAPDGTGLVFSKSGRRSWTLLRAVDHTTVRETLSGIRALMFDLGYTLSDEETIWDEAPKTREEAEEIEAMQKRDIANSWTDTDGTMLKDMDPYNSFPRLVGTREVESVDGEMVETEIWAYPLVNPNTGTEVELDPEDFRLLTDDRHFMRYKNSMGTVFQALTRKEMMDEADMVRDADGELVGRVDRDTGERVPSWLWGTYCKRFSDNLREI